ncbi:hypothetical protein POJ06DRAFT_141415 [Lipomyces tetrasporus]|uniref:Uncharacterized protein n=1 Tax=Lipomyces tetrasporus TaxID=54092 RepID=A0AAD7VS43_9ASCO|nr:uncharacterized protein POJ06DRAFT_141415 [Lipomyces tetrasporus]KAJ8098755.1 hypothetical protein POJ06DRAFT_141415 [Lipomyces tetrasporus]
MVSTTQTYFDLLLGRQSCADSPWASPHLSKALRLLRERLTLGDDEVKVSNITASVVLALAVHAHIMGEREAAEYHMAGLRKIVNLRGGVTTFRDNGKLLIELLRCDVELALHSGSRPLFFHDPSLEPFLPYPGQALSLKPGKTDTTGPQCCSEKFLNDSDDELARAWKVMKRFCSQINSAV